MNRLQKILGVSKTVSKTALSNWFYRNLPLPEGSTEQALTESYKKMELVYICISTTGRAISQVPLVVTEPNPDSPGGRRPVEETNPWQQLIWNPNPYMDRYSFIESMVGFLLLDGEVFVVPFPPGSGNPQSLWVVRSKYMEGVKEKKTGHLIGWKYMPDLQDNSTPSIFLTNEEVSRVYFWNPYNPYKGLSPLEAGKMSLTSDYQAALYNKKFFEEGAVPGGVLHTDQRISQRTFDRIKGQFEERHKGVEKSHKVAVLEQGLKYTQTGLSHKDMEYLELRKYSRQSILQVFGMKEAVLSISADINYACIPATERVLTPYGPRSIAEVEPGSEVWTLGEKGLEKRKVVNSWFQGKKKVFSLKTANFSLRASYDHPVLVLEGEELVWRQVEKIGVGDFVVVASEVEPLNGLDVSKILPPDFGVSKVMSIEEGEEEEVYDLEVEGRHNFICNGIVVHNTSREQIKMWWRGTNIPIMKLIESGLGSVLLSSGENRFSFDVSNVEALHDTFSDKVDTGEKLFKMGFTAGEINSRLGLGFDNKPWRDRWYIPINMVPVAEDGSMPLLDSEERSLEGQKEIKALPDGTSHIIGDLEESFRGKLRRVFYEMRKKSLELIKSDLLSYSFERETLQLQNFLFPLYKEAVSRGFFSTSPNKTLSGDGTLSDFLLSKMEAVKEIVGVIRRQVCLRVVESDFDEGDVKGIFNQVNTRAKDVAKVEVLSAFDFGCRIAREGEENG